MIRKIIKIEEEKCNGCGICVKACHEGAIGMVEGKAKLMREDYCDGLGDCLPACPTGAISFEEREAPAYDEAAVKAAAEKRAAASLAEPNLLRETREIRSAQKASQEKAKHKEVKPLPCGCPGTHSKAIQRKEVVEESMAEVLQSRLSQWPVQIKLVPVNAPYFDGANLLVAADCTAYAYANFHNEFIRNRITLVGCPKLDNVDYSEKLTQIIANNEIRSVTVVRMEVPCCGGIEHAVKKALMDSGKFIPWNVVTITTDGQILD